MQSLSWLFICSPVTGTAANNLYFLSNEYANMISLAFFILNIFNYISIFWVRSNHKRVNKHVFSFATPSSKDGKL